MNPTSEPVGADRYMPTTPAPDVVIAGAAKCGTTALATAMQRHPRFFLGEEKEPRFFTDLEPNFVGPMGTTFNETLYRDQDRYDEMYAPAHGRIRVDASTDYLAHPVSAARILAANPHASAIIGLRNPVSRAFSQHTHLAREMLESESFERALELEEERRAAHWVPMFWHVSRSMYADGLRAYQEVFKDRLFVYLHEDYVRDPVALLTELSEFLELESPIEEAGIHNRSGVPKSQFVNSVLRPRKFDFVLEGARKIVRSPQVRERLRTRIDNVNLESPERPSVEATGWILDRVKADVEATAELLDRDLSHWLD